MPRWGDIMVSEDTLCVLEQMESMKSKMDEHNGNMRDLIDTLSEINHSLCYLAQAFGVSKDSDSKRNEE